MNVKMFSLIKMTATDVFPLVNNDDFNLNDKIEEVSLQSSKRFVQFTKDIDGITGLM